MKLQKLKFGVLISEINLKNCPNSHLRDIVEICSKERLVILKKTDLSKDRFNEINDIFGSHQPANIWANHTKYPKIFRVTNKEVSKNKKGFLHRQEELGWHCNGVFSPDPEECISLYCIEPGINGDTEFADGFHAYKALDDSIKSEIENATISLTNEISKTYLKESIYGTLLPHEQRDLDKMSSRNRFYAGGAKGNVYDETKKYIYTNRKDLEGGKKRRKDIEKPLVVKHPLTGDKGLYFPFCSVSYIGGLEDSKRSYKIFNQLMENYVGKRGNIYRHSWEVGDLILSDQTHSLHRRLPYKGIRELYRTAFWYPIKNQTLVNQ